MIQWIMDKKQKEALVMALLEKGETYRDIARKAGVSPNTIKAIANKAGLSEIVSESSRVFELYVEQKTPIEVAIMLNLEADKAIRFYHEYFMLLGCTEFTKVYFQIKDNPWPYINLVNLIQNAGISDGEVIELVRIAKGHLARVRLEYDRLKQEKSSLEAEINYWKAELINIIQTYQDCSDRNLKLSNRKNELQLSINELEGKVVELQEIQ
jgi:predicted transcriptional regulator